MPNLGCGNATYDSQGPNRNTDYDRPSLASNNSASIERYDIESPWETLCKEISSVYLERFAVFDPPHVLVPGERMAPDPPKPITIDPGAVGPNSSPPAQPGQTPKADQPLQSAGPQGPFAADPGKTVHPDTDPQIGDPGRGTGVQDPKNLPAPDPQGFNPESPNRYDSPTNAESSGEVFTHDGIEPDDHSVRGGGAQIGRNGNAPPSTDPGIGRAIMQGFGPILPPDLHQSAANQGAQHDPDASQPTAAISLPAGQSLSIGDQTFALAAGGFMVAGTSIKPGDPAATIAGTPISLATGPTLVLGDKSYNLHPAATAGSKAAAPPALTVGAQIFTPDPTGFAMAGASLSPGGSAITISGTEIFLGQAGFLVIGGKTMALISTPKIIPPSLQAGNQISVTASYSFSIGAINISPGGPGVVVSGTSISFNPSGTLTYGTRTIDLNLATAVPVLTAGRRMFVPNPIGFTIAATTVPPGGLVERIGQGSEMCRYFKETLPWIRNFEKGSLGSRSYG